MKIDINVPKLEESIKELVKDVQGIYSESKECVFSNKGFQIHIVATKEPDDFIEENTEIVEII